MTEPSTFSPQSLRAWAVMALIAAISAASVTFAVVNFLEASGVSALADQQEPAVAQLERRVASKVGRPAASADVDAIYLAGATPTLARAELQRLLSATAERVGARVIETQDDQRDDALDLNAAGQVRLRLAFDARNDVLIAFLSTIETGLPLLTVERIEIRRLDAGSDGDPENPVLRIGLVVAGDGKFAS